MCIDSCVHSGREEVHLKIFDKLLKQINLKNALKNSEVQVGLAHEEWRTIDLNFYYLLL